jgi:hypothetical protein
MDAHHFFNFELTPFREWRQNMHRSSPLRIERTSGRILDHNQEATTPTFISRKEEDTKGQRIGKEPQRQRQHQQQPLHCKLECCSCGSWHCTIARLSDPRAPAIVRMNRRSTKECGCSSPQRQENITLVDDIFRRSVWRKIEVGIALRQTYKRMPSSS